MWLEPNFLTKNYTSVSRLCALNDTDDQIQHQVNVVTSDWSTLSITIEKKQYVDKPPCDVYKSSSSLGVEEATRRKMRLRAWMVRTWRWEPVGFCKICSSIRMSDRRLSNLSRELLGIHGKTTAMTIIATHNFSSPSSWTAGEILEMIVVWQNKDERRGEQLSCGTYLVGFAGFIVHQTKKHDKSNFLTK